MFACHTCHLDSQPTFRKALSRWHFAYNIMILFKFTVEECLKTQIVFNRQSNSPPPPQKPLGHLTCVAGGCEAVAALTQADVAGGETGRGVRFREEEPYPAHIWPAPQPGWASPTGCSGLSLDKLRRGPSISSSAGLPSCLLLPLCPTALSRGICF